MPVFYIQRDGFGTCLYVACSITQFYLLFSGRSVGEPVSRSGNAYVAKDMCLHMDACHVSEAIKCNWITIEKGVQNGEKQEINK